MEATIGWGVVILGPYVIGMLYGWAMRGWTRKRSSTSSPEASSERETCSKSPYPCYARLWNASGMQYRFEEPEHRCLYCHRLMNVTTPAHLEPSSKARG